MLQPDENGYYGNFGGAYVPEKLQPKIQELTKAYKEAIKDPTFIQEMQSLLQDYAGRPTPLYHAKNLSKLYGAEIYLKREDLNHMGAHKINNAIGQGLLAKRMGKTHVIAETGAGQHGVATATVCALLGLKCTIFMGATDMERQKPNVQRMEMLGATVTPAKSGGETLTSAVDEALGYWMEHPECFYMIGSAVGPHPYPGMVAEFQSVISKEMRKQLKEHTGRENPDAVIACIGGGSNAAGAFYYFIDQPDVRLIGAEAAGLGLDSGKHAATLTLGKETVLHGSKTMVIQDEEGNVKEPYSISAGLDYPGIGPMHAHLAAIGREEVIAITDDQALDAAFRLSRTEGIIPAIESSHALAVLEQVKFKPGEVVVVNLSGRGDKDMQAFIKHGLKK